LYKNDAVWAALKQALNSLILSSVSNEGEGPGEENLMPANIAETMEWTFVEDPKSLDGISTHDLRARFLAHRRQEFTREQPRVQDAAVSFLAEYTFHCEARYNFFIKVDEAVLQQAADEGIIETAAISNPSFARLKMVFVNVVDANWTPDLEEMFESGDEDYPYPPLEGFKSEYVGWYRVPIDRLDEEFYQVLSNQDCNETIWYLDYQRPPEIMYRYG
jgi:hypothetical protein